MRADLKLDKYEQDLEDNFELQHEVPHLNAEMALMKKKAMIYAKNKKAITLRIHEADLEVMRIKASKLGVPYQTYINILIHKDAASGI